MIASNLSSSGDIGIGVGLEAAVGVCGEGGSALAAGDMIEETRRLKPENRPGVSAMVAVMSRVEMLSRLRAQMRQIY